jgi:large subunit ribosomal protein L30
MTPAAKGAGRAGAGGGERISVRQVRSAIGSPRDQRATLRGLGLRRIGAVSTLVDTPAVRGMLTKVKHLVRIEEH